MLGSFCNPNEAAAISGQRWTKRSLPINGTDTVLVAVSVENAGGEGDYMNTISFQLALIDKALVSFIPPCLT